MGTESVLYRSHLENAYRHVGSNEVYLSCLSSIHEKANCIAIF